MAVTMQEQQTWSGDWKVMIVDTSSFLDYNGVNSLEKWQL